jgi:hypothetical protein
MSRLRCPERVGADAAGKRRGTQIGLASRLAAATAALIVFALAPASAHAVKQIAFDPPGTFDFGTFPYADQYSLLGVADVVNTGDEPVQVTAVDVEGLAFSDDGDACVGEPLQPDELCEVGIGFDVLQGYGTYTGSVVVESDAAGSPHRLPLRAVILPPRPRPPGLITASPGLLSFGDVMVGEYSALHTVTVSNRTGGPATLRPSIENDNPPGYFRITRRTCPYTAIAHGASCQLWVNFVPRSPGARRSRLVVRAGDAVPFTVQLRGVGVPRPLNVGPGLGRMLRGPIRAWRKSGFKTLRRKGFRMTLRRIGVEGSVRLEVRTSTGRPRVVAKGRTVKTDGNASTKLSAKTTKVGRRLLTSRKGRRALWLVARITYTAPDGTSQIGRREFALPR